MNSIVPGILVQTEEEYIKRLRLAELTAPLIQIDIVDGKFSPNKTVGMDVVAQNPSTSLLEIQLMVDEPSSYIEACQGLEFVSRVIFPFECKEDIDKTIKTIRDAKKLVGLSLNPTTAISAAKDYFEKLDFVLLMTGRPGYSGQTLGEYTYARIKELKDTSSLEVEIDIGVNLENAPKLAEAGAKYLVASSALFGEPDFAIAYNDLVSAVNNPAT